MYFKLIKPEEKYINQIKEYRLEMLANNSSFDGCGSLKRMADIKEWMIHMNDLEDSSKFSITCHLYIYVRLDDDKVIGMIQFLPGLNDVTAFAGNIGYSILPSQRRKHYATMMLHDFLQLLKEQGYEKINITCLPANVASKKTILKNGGIYDKNIYFPKDSVELEFYHIEL